MAVITGTNLSEMFSPAGKFVWNGSAWVRTSTAGTTNLNDLVNAGGGNDEVDGGGGNDALNGQAGADVLIGAGGNDAINGGDGDDIIYGGSKVQNAFDFGNDSLRGGNGRDTIYGGDGNDIVDGDAGNDKLFGEDGSDIVNGGTGRDVLTGGLGADDLTGGADGDFYTYNAVTDSLASLSHTFSSSAGDTIKGFTSAADTSNAALQDKIDLRGLVSAIGHSLAWTGTTASANGVWYEQSGSNTFVNIDTTGDGLADMVIKIDTSETLSAADFLGLGAAAAALVADQGVSQGGGGSNTSGATASSALRHDDGSGSIKFGDVFDFSTIPVADKFGGFTRLTVQGPGGDSGRAVAATFENDTFTISQDGQTQTIVDTDMNIAGVLP